VHFVSEEFLLFAVCFAAVFFFLGREGQKLLLLGGSYLFCGSQDLMFAALLALSTFVNYGVALVIDRNPAIGQRAMWAGIAFNVALLGVFKYFDFFSRSLNDSLSFLGFTYTPIFLAIALPLGLSFYTLQAISYLVDLREGKVERASFVDYAVYMSFWPKFVAGPIIRAKPFLSQLKTRRRFRWANFYLGAESVIYGLFLKTVLSDYLAPQVQKVYASPLAYGSADALLASIFYTFQIYGDFAGYSLVVIGAARILGYSVRPNFRRPNFARSFSDFWTRWHISLSRWLRDYVFRRLVPRTSGAALAQEWQSIAELYAHFLGVPNVSSDDTFASLSGDSLSFVQVALGLETYLGRPPAGWENMTIGHLEKLRLRSQLVREESVAVL
jgi:D-alanyl-lipoteichoic acid acyltransferase DltB (MBOAT superfamily)